MGSRVASAVETVPEPCVIAHTVMRPFCLGHHLLFKSFGLPFAGNPYAPALADDISTALAICGATYEATFEAGLEGRWTAELRAWRKRASGPWYRRRRVNWKESEQLFRAYLTVGYTQPAVCRSAPKPGCAGLTISAPWEEYLLVRLTQAGFSQSEVLNGYLPAMWYHYYTAMELRRADSCKDPKEWQPIFWTAQEAARYNSAGKEAQ